MSKEQKLERFLKQPEGDFDVPNQQELAIMAKRVLDSIDQQEQKRRHRRPWFYLLSTTVTASLGLLILWLWQWPGDSAFTARDEQTTTPQRWLRVFCVTSDERVSEINLENKRSCPKAAKLAFAISNATKVSQWYHLDVLAPDAQENITPNDVARIPVVAAETPNWVIPETLTLQHFMTPSIKIRAQFADTKDSLRNKSPSVYEFVVPVVISP